MPARVSSVADAVVDAVLAKVRSNPYAAGLSFDEPLVRRVVERHYSAVDAWPVHALTQ